MKVVEFTQISKPQIVVVMCIWYITDHGVIWKYNKLFIQ